MDRVARRRAACIVQKHSFGPVPSYGLRKAHSPSLVEGGSLGNSGTEGAVSAPLPLRFLKTCATAPMLPTSMKKPYTSGNAATPIKRLMTKILLW
jgi:hypothetical protein